MGELNAVSRFVEPRVSAMPLWIRVLLRCDGGFTTDVQARLAEAGSIDAFRLLHTCDPGYTLPALAPQIPLDYALVPPPMLPAVQACAPALDAPMVARASDHLPLVTVLGD
jgi:exonuclease III